MCFLCIHSGQQSLSGELMKIGNERLIKSTMQQSYMDLSVTMNATSLHGEAKKKVYQQLLLEHNCVPVKRSDTFYGCLAVDIGFDNGQQLKDNLISHIEQNQELFEVRIKSLYKRYKEQVMFFFFF